ncbi:ABC transporter permease [Photobacterium damselae]|uniref:ABC transporter permease n=1 Tax=Photobacterium damselae TaxID=38293 RepID=UPI001243AD5C|nr:ABC transporter permease [Photobacterium damselae]KAB1184328.1 ABC transporter permease [Photobacterium damselae subsp. damselae]MBF7101237.1 ABC transporter permease [Photobacterium damselae]
MNGAVNISVWALAGFYGLLLIPIYFFFRWQLKLTRSLITAVLRMTIQLAVVGLYLHTLFSLNHIGLNVLWLSVMISVAGYTVCKRAGVELKTVLPAVLIGLVVALVIALPAMLAGVIQATPWWDAQYMIPIAGMLLGNSLSANVLALERWQSQLKEKHQEYQFYVAIGAPNPSQPFIKTAMGAAVLPQIAAMTTLGIVSLPGMMTGQILGGTAPLIAVKYQLAIMVAIFISGILSVATTLTLIQRRTFSEYGEVK